MMEDLNADPWPDTSTPDWAPGIGFDFSDKTKTMPASHAADMLSRWHKRNPANFGNEYAKTSQRWALDKFGSEEN